MKLSQLAFLSPLILLPVYSYDTTTYPANGAWSPSAANSTKWPIKSTTYPAIGASSTSAADSNGKWAVKSTTYPAIGASGTSAADSTGKWAVKSTTYPAIGASSTSAANSTGNSTVKSTTFPAIGASNTSTAKSTTHTVIVGGQNLNLTFEPINTPAKAGDTVTFIMRAKNHSVTQSAFPTPCQPLIQSSNGTQNGFFSGFLSTLNPQDDSTGFAQFSIAINDTKPIWFYCSQTNHCAEGMVGSVNAASTGNTIDLYQDKAKNSGISNPYIPPVTGGTITLPKPTIHTVVAGGDDLRVVYDPSNFTAQPGDIVQVIMRGKNHTVTQSKFQTPCQPLSQTSNTTGIHSGFLPPANVSDDSIGDRTFTFTINNTEPLWFYCSQTNHCKSGMVFSVNAPATGNTFDAYKKLALNSGISQPYIPEVSGGIVSNASTPYVWDYATSNSGPYATSNSGPYGSEFGSTDLASSTVQKAKSIAKGVLIGIVAGAVGLLLLSVLAVYCCCCRKRKSRAVPGGEGGFMSYAAPSYRSISSPAPGAGVSDYEPLVPPGEKANAPHDDYHPSGAYDPPQPTSLGQYSTAWDQHK